MKWKIPWTVESSESAFVLGWKTLEGSKHSNTNHKETKERCWKSLFARIIFCSFHFSNIPTITRTPISFFYKR